MIETLTERQVVLRDYQDNHADKFADWLVNPGYGFDFSDPGTGKTLPPLEVANRLGWKIIIVTTKSGVPHWMEWCEIMGVESYEVTNWEMARRPQWRPIIDGPTFFTWDEFQRGGGPDSLQGRCMAKWGRKYPSLFLSATPFDTPLRTKGFLHATGIVDQLHWWKWVQGYGCAPNDFLPHNPMLFNGDEHYILAIKDLIAEHTVRKAWQDIDGFPDNRVYCEPIPVASIRKYNSKIDELRMADPTDLGEIQKLRVELELMKVPGIVDQANTLLENGTSAVVFCNFTESLRGIADGLGTDLVINGPVPMNRRATPFPP